MDSSRFARLPDGPCHAVIFSSQRTEGERGYGAMSERMLVLAQAQPGFLGIESARGADGFGITVSYWTDEASIARWRAHAEHRIAQETGKRVWYEAYELRIARVERSHGRRQPASSARASS